MRKIGVVSGGGSLPIELVRSAKKDGCKVIVLAVEGLASDELANIADKIYWIKYGQYAKAIFLLLKDRVKEIVLLGKYNKELLYNDTELDKDAINFKKNLKNLKDYSIFDSVTKHLRTIGIKVISPVEYLKEMIPAKGILYSPDPASAGIPDDIAYGYDIAKKLADMDIGQTLIIKDKNVVAVEALEGTNEVIKRGYKLAGEGCTMVKVSRSFQDMRWDIPTVGADTIEYLAQNGYKALAVESGKMFIAQKEKFLDIARSKGIYVEAV